MSCKLHYVQRFLSGKPAADQYQNRCVQVITSGSVEVTAPPSVWRLKQKVEFRVSMTNISADEGVSSGFVCPSQIVGRGCDVRGVRVTPGTMLCFNVLG